MRHRPFISNSLAQRLVEAAAERGVDAVALCRTVGLDRKALRDADGRTAVDDYFALWVEASARIEDPAFPIRVATAGTERHDVLRFVCMTGRDLRDALARGARYLGLLTDAAEWHVRVDGDRVALSIHRKGARSPGSDLADEFFAAEVVSLARLITGTDWVPREVHFVHDASRAAAAHRAYFRAPIAFHRERAAVVTDVASLDLALVKADASMAAFFERHATQLLAQRGDAPDTVAARVEQVLRAELANGTTTLDAVARRLGTSSRTLRRRLIDEGTTFLTVLDAVRFDLARRYLDAPRTTLSEVAFVLGFSEPSAFHRAFRRWAGVTPQTWRARRRADSTAAR